MGETTSLRAMPTHAAAWALAPLGTRVGAATARFLRAPAVAQCGRRRTAAAAVMMSFGPGAGGILGVGSAEVVVVLIVGVVVLGPKDLLKLARSTGALIGNVSRSLNDARRQLLERIDAGDDSQTLEELLFSAPQRKRSTTPNENADSKTNTSANANSVQEAARVDDQSLLDELEDLEFDTPTPLLSSQAELDKLEETYRRMKKTILLRELDAEYRAAKEAKLLLQLDDEYARARLAAEERNHGAAMGFVNPLDLKGSSGDREQPSDAKRNQHAS